MKKRLGNEFDLKKYNDQVISYGSPPLKYVRELMLQGTTASQPSK